METKLPNIPKHNFKVGDKVTVSTKIDRWSYGDNTNGWAEGMNYYLGKQFMVQDICVTGCVLTRHGYGNYTFAFESLQKYSPNEQLLLFELT